MSPISVEHKEDYKEEGSKNRKWERVAYRIWWMREAAMQTTIGRIILDTDTGILPEGWIRFKSRYVLGLGRLLMISGMSRVIVKLLIALKCIYTFYRYFARHRLIEGKPIMSGLVLFLLGIILVGQIFHMVEFWVSIVYVTKNDFRVRMLFNNWDKARRALWEGLKQGFRRGSAPQQGRVAVPSYVTRKCINTFSGNPGGFPGWNWENLGKVSSKGAKSVLAAGGGVVTLAGIADIHDRVTGTRKGDLLIRVLGVKGGMYNFDPRVEGFTKERWWGEMVKSYGEDRSKILLDEILKEKGYGFDINNPRERHKVMIELWVASVSAGLKKR